MQVFNAIGFCQKCSNSLIDVNGERKCLRCSSNRTIIESSPTDVKDPGEVELNRVVKHESVVAQPVRATVGSIEDVLLIMKKLPMPDDVKQFRKIKKIISLIEELVEPR